MLTEDNSYFISCI